MPKEKTDHRETMELLQELFPGRAPASRNTGEGVSARDAAAGALLLAALLCSGNLLIGTALIAAAGLVQGRQRRCIRCRKPH